MHVKMLQNNIDTLERMFEFVTKVHSTKRCIGTRKIISEEDEMQPNGRVFKKFNMGDYMWRSFIETEYAAACFGRGLRELGQQPRQNIVIFAETRAEWLIAAHGCFKQNMPLVTIYATLGDEGIAHGINETEVTTVITSHELLPKFKSVLNITPNVKKIIFMEDQLHKTETTGFKEGVEIIPFSTVVEKGEKSKMREYSYDFITLYRGPFPRKPFPRILLPEISFTRLYLPLECTIRQETIFSNLFICKAQMFNKKLCRAENFNE